MISNERYQELKEFVNENLTKDYEQFYNLTVKQNDFNQYFKVYGYFKQAQKIFHNAVKSKRKEITMLNKVIVELNKARYILGFDEIKMPKELEIVIDINKKELRKRELTEAKMELFNRCKEVENINDNQVNKLINQAVKAAELSELYPRAPSQRIHWLRFDQVKANEAFRMLGTEELKMKI